METDHLLIILPIPRPAILVNRLQGKHPNLKITYLRHEVDPVEVFKKQDMDIPSGMPPSTHNKMKQRALFTLIFAGD
jgi:hypothetical protein